MFHCFKNEKYLAVMAPLQLKSGALLLSYLGQYPVPILAPTTTTVKS